MPEKIQEIKQKPGKIEKPGLLGKDIISTELLTIGEIEIIIYLAQKLKVFRDHQMSTRFFGTATGIGIFSDDNFNNRCSFLMACAKTGIFPEIVRLSEMFDKEWDYKLLCRIAGEADLIAIYDEDESQVEEIHVKGMIKYLDLCVQNNLISNRPGLINFRSAVGWPVQALTDLLFLKDHFGSLKTLKRKKITISWEYSPDYTVSRTLPVSVIRLFSRFGMDVHLVYPPGYELPEDAISNALRSTKTSKGKFRQSQHFKKSLNDADIVYLIPWASTPFSELTQNDSISFEESVLVSEENTEEVHQGFNPRKWILTPKKLRLTKEGKALVMRWPVSFAEQKTDIEISGNDYSELNLDIHIAKRMHLETYIMSSMILANKFPNPNNLLQEIINNEKNL